MKKTSLLKKAAAVAAAAAMSCVMAVGAFAAGADYKLNSAEIKVGDTWTMSVPSSSVYDWNLSSEYFSYGHNMKDVEGVLKQVGYDIAGDSYVITYEAMMPGTCVVTLTDRSFKKVAEATVTVTGTEAAAPDTSGQETPSATPDETPADTTPAETPSETPDKPAEAPAAPDTSDTVTEAPAAKADTEPAAKAEPAASEDAAPVVDTRTAQQKEIDAAKANGTWGIEYTTCSHCGFHNWTRKGNVYVCDTCGNETTTVVGPKGVKGYVGSGAIAPVANKTAAPETRYATAKEAQAAADAREAAYADAVAAYRKQAAANEAAYLAALKG